MISRDEIRHAIPVKFNHRVIFTEHVFSEHNYLLSDLILEDSHQPRVNVLCFLDSGLVKANPKLLEEVSQYFKNSEDKINLVQKPVLLPGGEAVKQQAELFEFMTRLIYESKMCRHSYVIAVGGGSVLDAVCYAASVVHRGVRQIRVPTTVLGQDDAGIGVKNGINAFNQKNFLGTFYPPYAVVNDCKLLTTLDQAQWRNGTSEAVKVALIRDPEFFYWIHSHAKRLIERDLGLMKLLIRRCAELHLHHIATAGDPFEQGSSRPLDFGHWAAHKIEQLSQFTVPHGQAVAIGIAIDVSYSYQMGFLSESDRNLIFDCLKNLGFELTHPVLSESESKLLSGIDDFREHLGGELTITLLERIGVPLNVHEINPEIMKRSIHYLFSLDV